MQGKWLGSVWAPFGTENAGNAVKRELQIGARYKNVRFFWKSSSDVADGNFQKIESC